MKIIFLDLDGVIQIDSSDYMFYDGRCLNNLNRLLDKTGAKIVVSSSTRCGRSIEDIRNTFARNGDHYGCFVQEPVKFDTSAIIGKTPDFAKGLIKTDKEYKRGDEIFTWLRWAYIYGKYDVNGIVILDDDTDMEPFMDKLVITKSDLGLTEQDVERAQKIINEPFNSCVRTN